jgi:hypothetical protein
MALDTRLQNAWIFLVCETSLNNHNQKNCQKLKLESFLGRSKKSETIKFNNKLLVLHLVAL